MTSDVHLFKRVEPYCLAIICMTFGHCMSAAEKVRNHVGIPSCLIIPSTSYTPSESTLVIHEHSSGSDKHPVEPCLLWLVGFYSSCCQCSSSVESTFWGILL